MPRQGWETNKAGGKGPSAAGESDKSPPQPSCPVHPRGQTGPPAPRRAPPSAQDHLLPWPLRPLLRRCPRSPLQPLAAAEQSPTRRGPVAGRAGHRRAPALPSPDPPCAPGWGLGNPAGLPERGQGLGPAAPGACGGARRQSSLASRWIAAPLQFRIPFLPDKPRRIFINQSATLFNKNLLTYK